MTINYISVDDCLMFKWCVGSRWLTVELKAWKQLQIWLNFRGLALNKINGGSTYIEMMIKIYLKPLVTIWIFLLSLVNQGCTYFKFCAWPCCYMKYPNQTMAGAGEVVLEVWKGKDLWWTFNQVKSTSPTSQTMSEASEVVIVVWWEKYPWRIFNLSPSLSLW